jgi:hypothetical protein
MSVATGSHYKSHDKAGRGGSVGDETEARERVGLEIHFPSATPAYATRSVATRPDRGGRLAGVLARIFGSDDLLVRMTAVSAKEIEAVKRTGS